MSHECTSNTGLLSLKATVAEQITKSLKYLPPPPPPRTLGNLLFFVRFEETVGIQGFLLWPF